MVGLVDFRNFPSILHAWPNLRDLGGLEEDFGLKSIIKTTLEPIRVSFNICMFDLIMLGVLQTLEQFLYFYRILCWFSLL